MAYDVFNFIIKAIRDQDDERVLERFVSGFQGVYELALFKAEDLRSLFSQMTVLSGDQLDFPLATFGVTKDLSRRLTNYQKRKLLGLMISLWKVKCAKLGVSPMLNSVGQVRATYDELFDWRWLLEDKQLSQEDYIISKEGMYTVDLYVESPAHQGLRFYVLRPLSGLVRVVAKPFGEYTPEGGGTYGLYGPVIEPSPPSPPIQPPTVLPAPAYTVESGDKLIYDIMVSGGSAFSGIDLFLDDPDDNGANPHWMGETGGLLDSEGFEFSYAENYTPALGRWKVRRTIDLTNEEGNAIYGLGVYNNDRVPGAYQTDVKTAYIKKADGNIFPVFIEPSTWTDVISQEGPTGLTYEITSPQVFSADWPLVKEVAKLMRPVGEWFHLYPVFERYDRLQIDLPSLISQGVSVDEESLVFPTTGSGRIATRIPLEYIGSCAYGLSLLVRVPWTLDGSQYYMGEFADGKYPDAWVPPEGEDPALIDIYIGKVSSQTYYKVRLDFATCVATVYKSLYGNENVVSTGSFDPRGYDFRVLVFMEGMVLTLKIDDNSILRYEEPEDRLAGSWEIRATNLRLLELSALPIPAVREEIP